MPLTPEQQEEGHDCSCEKIAGPRMTADNTLVVRRSNAKRRIALPWTRG